MKRMKRIPITAAKRIADEFGYDQVIVYGRKTGEGGGEHMTTYGVDVQHCRIAADMGNALKPLIAWSGAAVGAFLRKIAPAALRPGMYAGEQAGRTEDHWRADAALAYVKPKTAPTLEHGIENILREVERRGEHTEVRLDAKALRGLLAPCNDPITVVYD